MSRHPWPDHLLSLDEWAALPPFDQPCELAEGVLIVSPRPSPTHQWAIARLSAVLNAQLPDHLAAFPETEVVVSAARVATVRVPGAFSLGFLVFNGISNLLTQAEQVECFRNAARHLTPGGRFVIELWVPKLPHPNDPQAIVGAAQDGYILVDTYDVEQQLLVSNHFRFGEGKDARVFRSPHRYVWPAELDLMAELAGFELESRHADWHGAPFTASSPSHVSVYRLSA